MDAKDQHNDQPSHSKSSTEGTSSTLALSHSRRTKNDATIGDVRDYTKHIIRMSCSQIVFAQSQHYIALSAQRDRESGGMGGGGAAGPAGGGLPQTRHVAVSRGFLDTLADIAEAFLWQLGKIAHDQANLAGRTQMNLNDVIVAVNDSSVLTNTTIADLARYSMFEEIPFPQKVHPFPIPSKRAAITHAKKKTSSSSRLASDPSVGLPSSASSIAPFVETWMPDLPPAHTYIKTPGLVANTNLHAKLLARSMKSILPESAKKTKNNNVNNDENNNDNKTNINNDPKAVPPGITVEDFAKQRKHVQKAIIKIKSTQSMSAQLLANVSGNPFLKPPRVSASNNAHTTAKEGSVQRWVLEPDDYVPEAADPISHTDDENVTRKKAKVETIISNN